ncbi:DUF4942 domain-containing protein [Shewanella sp. MBTL60-007]|uniref:class I SAM-dependent methyltransferase n=1 Tax=Shewanella sp. MBTL60-007 TaxID=2815911 RepID=UPI001BC6B875|nr:DUF4942 domain-containing protein [Shewanella sp. MBTL60-007]GIU20984.1 hypothetical protein TUM3792_21310 [Shewanella sp. MBTL60-007]
MKTTNALLQTIKAENCDYNWYPTTDDILASVKSHLKGNESLLDVGAGDGRSLKYLTNGTRYAIEKSKPLIKSLDADIFIIGTDFHEQTLLDKRCDVIFSNPPFSEFEMWAQKIILEAQATFVFLVLPERWAKSDAIADAIKQRKAKVEVIHQTDFTVADRPARAKVDVLKIELAAKVYGYRSPDLNVDPFTLWFDTNFPLNTNDDNANDIGDAVKDEIQTQLVAGQDLVSILEQLYQRDFNKLLNAYSAICDVDGSILSELDIDKKVLAGGLKQKAASLKDKYWRLLFENLEKVTDRLTATSRSEMFSVLTKNTHVDFTSGNAFGILEWVIKNANQYFDQQLIDCYSTMLEKANVILYKSNSRVFTDEDWKYCRKPDDLSHYKFDYRIVLSRVGGLDTYWSHRRGELAERAASFVNDLCTVAHNLGYDTHGCERAGDFDWESGKKCIFHFYHHTNETKEQLFQIKAFKNGNLHLSFSKSFICKLNVEFGRLVGWLKSKHEAAEELDLPLEEVEDCFDSNLQLSNDYQLLLGVVKAA